MRVTKVTYQKAFVTGPFLQEKIGFEAELDGNNGVDLFPETPESALSQLKELADKWHKENNPQLNGSDLPPHLKTEITFGPPPTIQTEKSDPYDTLSLIQNAPSMEVLATFKLLAGKNPDLYKAYCERLKYLSA